MGSDQVTNKPTSIKLPEGFKGDNGISARGCEAETWEGLHLLMGCSFNLARIFKSVIKIAPSLLLLKAFFLQCNVLCKFGPIVQWP